MAAVAYHAHEKLVAPAPAPEPEASAPQPDPVPPRPTGPPPTGHVRPERRRRTARRPR